MVRFHTRSDGTEVQHACTVNHETASFPRTVLMLVALYLKLYGADISCYFGQDHYGSVILVDSLGRTDLPLYISEVRGYECGRVGSKLAHLSAKAATHVSDEKLHADRATHPGIIVDANLTVCGARENLRACDHAALACRWWCCNNVAAQ